MGFIIAVLVSINKFESESIIYFMHIAIVTISYTFSVFIHFWRKSIYKPAHNADKK